jgi:hypothetical protein
MNEEYQITQAQMEWARRTKQGLRPAKMRELIKKQKGRCALSGAEMIFAKEHGNPNINPKGCHPLYAAIDHVSPTNDRYGHQLVCYDLNDLKGSLPYKLFKKLQLTEPWRTLMSEWCSLAEADPMNIEAFKELLSD